MGQVGKPRLGLQIAIETQIVRATSGQAHMGKDGVDLLKVQGPWIRLRSHSRIRWQDPLLG